MVGIGIDGVVGPSTWKALEEGRTKNPVVAATIPVNIHSAPWMAIAKNEIGQKEVQGSVHNNRIIEYHTTTTLRATSDETAWCSSFVNWCLMKAGVTGTNSAAAASWLNWGKTIAGTSGAIIVINNSRAARSSLSVSGNHVGFLVQETGTHFRLLGGNQSNQVKISSYPKTSWNLKGYRWPNS